MICLATVLPASMLTGPLSQRSEAVQARPSPHAPSDTHCARGGGRAHQQTGAREDWDFKHGQRPNHERLTEGAGQNDSIAIKKPHSLMVRAAACNSNHRRVGFTIDMRPNGYQCFNRPSTCRNPRGFGRAGTSQNDDSCPRCHVLCSMGVPIERPRVTLDGTKSGP